MNYAIQQLYARRRREQTVGSEEYYHGTPKKNLKSILLKGMIAMAGENSRAAGDLDRTVSLTPDKKLARSYAGKGGALLAVDPEHSSLEAHRFEPDPHEKKSVRTLRGIPPQAIRVAEASAHMATRNWRGLDVDHDMLDQHLAKLNTNPHGQVVSSCAGHPELKGTHSAMGGDDHPGFNIILHTPDRDYAEKLSDHLDDKDTSPQTSYHGGPYGNVCTHWNGFPRDLSNIGFDAAHQKEIKDAVEGPTKKIVLHVRGMIPNTGHNAPELHAWWDRTLDRLHSFKHAPKPSKTRSKSAVESDPKAGRVDLRRPFTEAARSEITPARLAQQFGYRNVFNTDSNRYGEVKRYLHPNGHNLIVTRRLKLGRDRVQNAADPGAWDMQWSHTTSGNEVNNGHTVRGLFDRLSIFHRTR